MKDGSQESVSRKFFKVMAITISFPSTIIGVSILFYTLAEEGVISHLLAFVFIFIVIFYFLYLIVRHGTKKTKKSSDPS